MSPDDDQQLHGSTTTSIPDIALNGRWKSLAQPEPIQQSLLPPSSPETPENTHIFDEMHPPNKQKNGNGIYTNGKNNGVTKNGHDTWTPLLQNEQILPPISTTVTSANNNEWTNITPMLNKKSDDEVWGSPDDGLLHDDEHLNHLKHTAQIIRGNNNVSLINGKTGLVENGQDSKLSEQDPLTGIVRDMDLDDQSSCGIGSCKPKWAGAFASTHVFMVVFLLAWILQGMYFTYFVSVITTIEKLFQIKSKTTGMLLSSVEVGQICTALFLTYFAGRGHRPRWIACGMVVFAFASFGCTLPHFIYGQELLSTSSKLNGLTAQQSNAAARALNSSSDLNQMSFWSDASLNLCHAPGTNGSFSDRTCEQDALDEQAAQSQITVVVLCIFFVSLFCVGVGQTAVSTLGIPYIDDNVASRESPIYLTITIGVRILGPAAGFILGSFCTRLYVDFTDPGIGPTDPKWVGAWWLGLVLVSSLMMMTSLAMFTFPKNLRGNRIPPPMKLREAENQKKLVKPEEETKPQLKDFPKTIRRQLSNDILMFRTASSVLHLLPLAGLYTFLPKYLESQFRLPAHDANLISGLGGILVMGVGIVISGVVILKFSPTARSVAGWIAFTALVYSVGMGILMFVGCSMDDFVGLKQLSQVHPQKLLPSCNMTCECDFDKFTPICGSDGRTYFSSCHAGCNSSVLTVEGHTQFTNCECIMPNIDAPLGEATALSGYCDGNCQNFLLFISLFSFLVFMHSTSEVGSMLLIMRCTDPKDKAMAMGIIQFAIGLFGNVPCPIIYGAVVDSACLVWETICGKQGACSLYDVDTFRYFFLGTTSGIMFLAFIMDLVVWHKAHRIDIDPEATSSASECEKPTVVPESSV